MSTVTEHEAHGTAVIPEQTAGMRRSPHPEIDTAVEGVAARRDRWAATDVEARIALLDRMIRDAHTVADHWVAVECERKHIPSGTPVAGEEWFAGPALAIRNLRLLRDTLRDIARHGHPRLPGRVRRLPNGQVAAAVFPTGGYDRLEFAGFAGEVWMQPGVTADEVLATVGGIYRGDAATPATVGAVLGAGNVSSIPVNDVLYKVFAENQVVVLKLSPLAEPLGPVIGKALRALTDEGFLRIVYGGAAEARHLIGHPLVSAVHMTGSDKTHDAIVFGPGTDGERRRAAGTPLLTKAITSELGSVTPMIVVPGRWSSSDIGYQAEHIATTLAHNGGFNCVATRVLVMPRGWDRRDDLLAALRRVLRRLPNRYAYYPGARERFASFIDSHGEAERLGGGGPGSLPWAFLTGVDESGSADVCSVDPFAPVLSEVLLDAGSPAEFLDRAVAFCNERLWGTLGATVLVDQASARDRDTRAAVRRAEQNLRYGNVMINHWSAAPYALISPPWGAFPGHPLTDIQSGRGFVHNSYLFTRPEKTVVHAPFRSRPRPPWFVTNSRQREALSAFVDLEASQQLRALPPLLVSALRGGL